VIIPPLGNYGISLFKDTSLVSIVTVKELIFTGQIISSTNFEYVTVFTIIGAIYLAFSYPSALVVRWLERRMKVGGKAKAPATTPRATAATP
jgi:polar amino acid transport system permease protein